MPLMAAAIWLYARGSLRGGFLLVGSLVYCLYSAFSLGTAAAYNPLFLVYTAAFTASLFALGLAWTRIDDPRQLRVNAVAFGGRMSTMGSQPRNAVYGVPGKLAGLALGVDGEARSGLKWQFGVSVQHYPAGGRPAVGLLAGIELPIAK